MNKILGFDRYRDVTFDLFMSHVLAIFGSAVSADYVE